MNLNEQRLRFMMAAQEFERNGNWYMFNLVKLWLEVQSIEDLHRGLGENNNVSGVSDSFGDDGRGRSDEGSNRIA